MLKGCREGSFECGAVSLIQCLDKCKHLRNGSGLTKLCNQAPAMWKQRISVLRPKKNKSKETNKEKEIHVNKQTAAVRFRFYF